MLEKYGTVRLATGENIIQRMGFACWITKVTDTHSEYVIVIPCLRQQWLSESACILGRSTLPVLFETILDSVLQTDI